MGLTHSIAQNLRKPSSGIVGSMVVKNMVSTNTFLELNAVRLCHLEPHHHVLEIGFGPGIGLKAATELIVNGKVYGLDYSPEMVEKVSTSLKPEIISGKLQVDVGDVASLPYPDASMDRIFHCNCYYFWPEPRKVTHELYRVLKPGGFMVTALNIKSTKNADRKGRLKGANWRPEPYMEALRDAGFTNVKMDNLVEGDGTKAKPYEAIMAHKT